jgi:hypothetical protein
MAVQLDAAGYVDFLRRLGHRVVRTRSSYWYDASRLFFMSAPPHRLYEPSGDELRLVLRKLPCLGLRFATPFAGVGKPSYQLVCDNSTYGSAALSGNVRRKVRQGLKRCVVRPVSFAELATAGRRAHQDTLARQGRGGVLEGKRWDRFWTAAAATPVLEGWGAWAGDILAAFLVTITFQDGVEFTLERSCSDELGAYPNNALIFSVAEELLVRRGAPEITFGLESLEPVGPLDQFKLSMGFRQRPLRQRVVFHPVLRALLRQAPVRAAFRRWTDRRANDAVFWRKAAGLLRFAEEAGL